MPPNVINWSRVGRAPAGPLDHFPLFWPALQWTAAADYGIDMGNDRWNAGHVTAIIADGTSVVVGAATGGVWLVNPAIPQSEGFRAEPVSWDWSNPNIGALAFAPNDPTTVFAGCTLLGDSDACLYLIKLEAVAGGLELVKTAPLPLWPSDIVYGIVTLPDPGRIVLATDSGVFWSYIPPDPTQTAAYTWQAAIVRPDFTATGIALGPNDTVVVASWANGMYVGQWSPAGLRLAKTPLPPATPVIEYTSVASCESDRWVLYSAASAPRDADHEGAVLRSGDGGNTWSLCQVPQTSGYLTWYNRCVAVHPTDSDIVAVALGGGPFISHDRGQTWELRNGDGISNVHGDVHVLTFEEMGDGVGLYAGTDGGVCLSMDLGKTWDSRYNKHLRNLQFYSLTNNFVSNLDPVATDNSPFDVSADVPGLNGGATQDNYNIWCLTGNDNASASFHSFGPGGDGGTVVFVAEAESVLHKDTGDGRLRVSRWQDGTLTWNDWLGDVVPAAGLPDGMPSPKAISPVQTASASIGGNRLRVVVGKDTKVYGYVDGGADGSFVAIADVGATITSIASLDGYQILVGTGDGKIYTVDTATGTFAENATNLGGLNGNPITQLIWTGHGDSFGISGGSTVIRWANNAWEPAPGTIGADVSCIAFERVTTGGALFACTDFGVSVSMDRGDSWIEVNSGLPKRPHCSSVCVGLDGHGRPSLFLSTYGWSTFVATLPARSPHVPPRIPSEVAHIVAGIINDGDGIEIIGDTIVRVPPREPARDLAVAVVVAALVELLSEEHIERGREFMTGFTTFGGSERI
jgi:hypothetical protein